MGASKVGIEGKSFTSSEKKLYHSSSGFLRCQWGSWRHFHRCQHIICDERAATTFKVVVFILCVLFDKLPIMGSEQSANQTSPFFRSGSHERIVTARGSVVNLATFCRQMWQLSRPPWQIKLLNATNLTNFSGHWENVGGDNKTF